MRITVFGASGGTGTQVVEQALAAGHEVIAPVRDPSRLTVAHDSLTVLEADVRRPESIAPAVVGADAVISSIGSGSRTEVVHSEGTGNIIAAMQAAQTRRLLVVSAAPVADDDPNDTVVLRKVMKPLMWRILRNSYLDMGLMEQQVRRSGLEWTIVRPPRLTNGSHTGRYRTELDHTLRRGYSISRADLADLLLRSIEDPAAVKSVVAVGY